MPLIVRSPNFYPDLLLIIRQSEATLNAISRSHNTLNQQSIKSTSRLQAQGLSLSYAGKMVSVDISVGVQEGKFSVIIGPNGCGKSTLLRGLCNLLPPSTGQVLLDGQDIARLAPRKLAQEIGLLPQSAQAPPGITVIDLVGRGRYPHQGPFRQQSAEDERIVGMAMDVAGISDLAHHDVEALSGGQRQRVWIALVLAQETPILLLDEPTTYLDITHQMEVLRIADELRSEGRTVVAVLHELALAARFATDLIAMRDGEIRFRGTPAEVATRENLKDVFDLDCRVIADPELGHPVVLPN